MFATLCRLINARRYKAALNKAYAARADCHAYSLNSVGQWSHGLGMVLECRARKLEERAYMLASKA